MSKSQRIMSAIAAWMVVGLLLVGGCAQPQKTPADTVPVPVAVEPNVPEPVEQSEAVELTLRFKPDQIGTYRATTAAAKSLKWEGDTSSKPADFADGSTGHHTEITFKQQVQRVDDEGNALLKITIEALKHQTRRLDVVDFDFDSTRSADQDSPFAKLIGLGYSIEMSPKGEVLAVTDLEPALAALAGSRPEQQIVRGMLDEAVIKARHEVDALKALTTNSVTPGQNWSDVQSLNFGSLGIREFERIFTLDSVETDGDDRVAMVTMSVIPSSALAQQLHLQQQTNPFSQMFDSTDHFEGQLELDLTTGQLLLTTEEFDVQWIAVDPAANQVSLANPAALRMGATQLHRLERID